MSVRHIKVPQFNKCYGKLPPAVQKSANKQFQLLKKNPGHPSLEFRQLSVRSDCWYARVTDDYRALATKYQDVYIWFWIGTHAKFNTLTARPKNLVPKNIPFERIEEPQTQLTTSLSFMSGRQGSSQASREDVNSVELNNLIQEAISDFNENRYEEWD